MRLDLEMGRGGHVESFLSVAEKVTVALGGRGGGEYRRWLRETVGSLKLVDARHAGGLDGWVRRS